MHGSLRIFFWLSAVFSVSPIHAQSSNQAPELVFTGGTLVERWARLGKDIDGEAVDDSSGRSVSLSADGLTAAIGAGGNDGNGSDSGHTRVYRYNERTTQWEQLGEDIDGEAENDRSGDSVSLSANGLIAAIGAPRNDGNGSDSGHTRVYRYNEGTTEWEQLGEDIDGEAANDTGSAVSLSADGLIAAIGAPRNDGNGTYSGHTRVYRYNEGMLQWEQLGEDIDGEAESDFSSWSVSLSADGFTVAIGAPLNDGNGSGSGHTRIYRYNEGATQWEQLGEDIDGEAQGGFSGHSVSLSANGLIAAIGAPHYSNSDNGSRFGHTRVYRYNEGMLQWEQLGEDIDGEAAHNRSGWSVSLSAGGLTIAIGAVDNDGNGSGSGHTRIYRYNEGMTQWEQLGEDIDGEAVGDFSGGSVSLSADGLTAAIGAELNDGNGSNSGHTRLYRYNPNQVIYSIAENTTAITNVMTMDDADSEGSGLTYGLAGIDAELFSCDETTGELAFITAPDFEMPTDDGADNVYDLNIIVTDSGTLFDSESIAITVTDVNESLSLTGAVDLNLGQNGMGAVNLILSDQETLNGLTIFAESSNQNLLLDSSLFFTGAGSLRTLTVIPVAGQVGTTTVTITLSSDAYSITETFIVTVANQAPELVFTDGTLTGLWEQLGEDIIGEGGLNYSGSSVSLSADGFTAAIGAPLNDGNGTYSGHTRIYRYNEGTTEWEQLGEDIDGEAALDQSGGSVSLSADGLIIAIGATRNDGNGTYSGHTRIYRYNQGTMQWQQLGEDIDGEAENDYSGRSVSLSANGFTVAIGAGGNDGNGNASGHARIYRYNEGMTQWEQMGEDIDGEAANDLSGWTISLSADGLIIAIGALSNDVNGLSSGHTRIYRYNEGTTQWEQLGEDIDGEEAYDRLGSSVSLSADGLTAAIIAKGADGNRAYSGHTRIYRYNGVTAQWKQLGEDIDGDGLEDSSVSLSADGLTIAIGAGNSGSGFGFTRIYRYNQGASQWEQLGEDIDGEAAYDGSGASVSLSADGLTAAIGAPDSSRNFSFSGHTRIYRFQPTQTNYYLAENTTVITDVQARDDVDSESSGLSYSLTGIDADLFSIDEITGELAFVTVPDFEMPTDDGADNIYDLNITVTDSEGLFETQAIAITVTEEVTLEILSALYLEEQSETLLEYLTTPGAIYAIEYSEDLQNWFRISPSFRANANMTQWTDNGPPQTSSRPTGAGRFYRYLFLQPAEE